MILGAGMDCFQDLNHLLAVSKVRQIHLVESLIPLCSSYNLICDEIDSSRTIRILNRLISLGGKIE